jgi:hypothetical protein
MTPELWNSSLLGNGSVNTFPRKRKPATLEEPVSKQRIGNATKGVLLETVFSVGAALWLYNKDLRQLELELEKASEVGSWQNNGKKGIRLCKEDFMCAAVRGRLL